MRAYAITAGIGLAAILLAGCGDKGEPGKAAGEAAKAPAAEVKLDLASMPKRKPGFWEQTVKTGDGPAMVSKLCLDAATEAKIGVMGQGMGKDMCSQMDMTRRLDGSIAFSSTCSMGPQAGTTKSTGVITGDFNSGYKVKTDTVIEGSSIASLNGPQSMTMDVKWLGPCPAGFAPGDMEVAGGHKVNLLQMPAFADKK